MILQQLGLLLGIEIHVAIATAKEEPELWQRRCGIHLAQHLELLPEGAERRNASARSNEHHWPTAIRRQMEAQGAADEHIQLVVGFQAGQVVGADAVALVALAILATVPDNGHGQMDLIADPTWRR